MAKIRFTRLAYVRQLERLYDELSHWRDDYQLRADYAWHEQRAYGYMDRQNALADVQQDLMVAIRKLYNLPTVR